MLGVGAVAAGQVIASDAVAAPATDVEAAAGGWITKSNVSALSFLPDDAAAGWEPVTIDNRRGRTVKAGPAALVAPVRIPPGSPVRQVSFSVAPATGGAVTCRVVRADWATGEHQIFGEAQTTADGRQEVTFDVNVPATLEGSGQVLAVCDVDPGDVVFGAQFSYLLNNALGYQGLVPPRRVYDSRGDASGSIRGGEFRRVRFADSHYASAWQMQVTAVSTSGSGYLTVSSRDARSPISNLNWYSSGQTVANSVLVSHDGPWPESDGIVDVYCGGSGATHFLLDLMGVYQ